MPKVEIRHVSKTFSSKPSTNKSSNSGNGIEVLRDVNVALEKDEFVSIVGPSGCGKTTLLRLAAGLIELDEGQILIDGNLVNGPNPNVTMVFQQAGLLPWRTVMKNAEFALEVFFHRSLKEEERQEVEQYLNLVGLKGFEGYYPHQLSGGMQQRVGLARALLRNPDVLLMDEPFGALDAQTRLILQDELLRIRRRHAQTVLFVTHDLDEAIYLSDRIAILTKRPGVVKTVLDVDLQKPRFEYDVRSHPRFVELRRTAWETLRAEIGETLT